MFKMIKKSIVYLIMLSILSTMIGVKIIQAQGLIEFTAEDGRRSSKQDGSMIVYEYGSDAYPHLTFLTKTKEEWATSKLKTDIQRCMIKLNFLPTSKLAIYGKVGLGRLSIGIEDLEQKEIDVYGDSYYYDIDYIPIRLSGSGNWGLTYGIGIRHQILKTSTFKLWIEGEWNYLESKDIYKEYTEGTNLAPDDYEKKGIYSTIFDKGKVNEFKGNLGVSTDIGKMSPYGGILLSYMSTTLKGKYTKSSSLQDLGGHPDTPYSETYTNNLKYKSKPDDGYTSLFVGTNYNLTSNSGFKVEVRVGAEKIITTSFFLTLK
ncbi:MAG: hypothetical protein AB1414_15645 [bacterium]